MEFFLTLRVDLPTCLELFPSVEEHFLIKKLPNPYPAYCLEKEDGMSPTSGLHKHLIIRFQHQIAL